MTSAGCMITLEPGDPPLMVLSGEFNYESAPKIREVFGHLAREGHLKLAIDCRAVDFIDSSGIGAIVYQAQSLRSAGGSLRLCAATPQLMHALTVSGFAQLFDIDLTALQSVPVKSGEAESAKGVWQQAGLSIPVQANQDAVVRRRVVELASSMAFTVEQIDDIRLAVGEAVSNAIRHGCTNRDTDRISVRCTGDHEKLVLEIHNPGEPFDPDAVPVPDPCRPREGGMGIFFMRATMDLVEYSFDDTGTTVRMVKYIDGSNRGKKHQI